MQLAELQQRFLAYLLVPSQSLATQQHFISELIDGENAIRSSARLGIYHHAYRARLLEVMQDVFERTWAYLGDDGFAAAAHGYIESAPSSGRTLNRFGESFPAWLATSYPADGDLAEVARIDWMMRIAFDAADAVPISFDALAILGPEQWDGARFVFHPSLQTARMHYNAASIWGALEAEHAPPPPERLVTPAAIVVWRKDTRPHFLTVGALEAEAITRLQRGETFGQMCEALNEIAAEADVALAVGGWLKRWLDEGMLSDLKVPV
jgi:hypothetical protein